MLLKRGTLGRIQAGEIDLVFRRWKRPTVKTGGTLKTAVGVLSILEVKAVGRVTSAEAARAGYASRADLMAELDSREGDTYRIRVAYAGEDPRLALRENDRLTPEEMDEVLARLARMDRASEAGPWTRDVLDAIRRHPRKLAADLAADMGREKRWLKPNVRKLKALGLTISHDVGYSLSPRGKVVLKELGRR